MYLKGIWIDLNSFSESDLRLYRAFAMELE